MGIERNNSLPRKNAKFKQEFTSQEIKQLFKTTEKTLVKNCFGRPAATTAWMLRYCRSEKFGYIRILELEGVSKRRLTAALDKIARDFKDLEGIIIDIRDNPGGDDSIVIAIINRFVTASGSPSTGRRKLAQAKMTSRLSRPGASNRKETHNSLSQLWS